MLVEFSSVCLELEASSITIQLTRLNINFQLVKVGRYSTHLPFIFRVTTATSANVSSRKSASQNFASIFAVGLWLRYLGLTNPSIIAILCKHPLAWTHKFILHKRSSNKIIMQRVKGRMLRAEKQKMVEWRINSIKNVRHAVGGERKLKNLELANFVHFVTAG